MPRACCVRYKTCDSYQHIVLVYRPHNLYDNSDVTENNTKLAKLVTVLPKPNIIVGDRNYSDIEWETKQAKTKQSRDFIQTTEDNFLQQYVNFPTHNSGRILDLVLSEGDNVISVEDQGKLGSSDHNMILIYIRGRVPKREKAQTSRDWKKS